MSCLHSKLAAGRFVLTVEINPPASHDVEAMLQDVDSLPLCIDAIDLTNCPFSRTRINPIALGHLIQERCHREVIVNWTCRSRNSLATTSDLLGALALGIRNILCITGDDPSSGDHPESSSVVDLDVCGLIRRSREIRLPQGTAFSVAAATSVERSSENERTLAAKIAAGAQYFITQPVYSIEDVEMAARLQEHAQQPFLLGILPLKNWKMGRTLSAVPGIVIPPAFIDDLDGCSADECRERSVEQILPVAKRAKELLGGMHLMPIGELRKVRDIVQFLSLPSFLFPPYSHADDSCVALRPLSQTR